MKKRSILLLLAVIMAGVIVIGQFKTSASEINLTEDNTSETGQVSSGEQEPDTNQEERTTEITGDDVKDNERNSEEYENEEDTAETSEDEEIMESPRESDITDNVDEDIEGHDMDEEPEWNSVYYQGLIYYLNWYQYECEIAYLDSYMEYIKLEVAAVEKLYELGEVTAADVKSYQAQQASIEAQIKAAKNQKSYNNLYLKENNLDYSDYSIKEKKDVVTIDYYVEQYPEKNYMTMAGYVTSYNNAIAYIEAKKIEIEALSMKLESSKLLYEAGEISKLELKQQGAALAKAQYELEQYYVEMNLAYININAYCK